MWCTTECWSCNDKSCEHYRDKQDVWLENMALKHVLNKFTDWMQEWHDIIDAPDTYEEGIIDCLDDCLERLDELRREHDV